MGFARLRFDTGAPTSAQALFDVVKLVTGAISTAAGLTYASTTNSTVVNTKAENWSVVYGSVAATTTAYVLSSPTLLSGKTHYVRMMSRGTSGNSYPSTGAFSSSAITVTTITSATSASAVTNETYYQTSDANTGVLPRSDYPDIFVHWSARHILLYGASNASTVVVGSFQYPYNQLNQYGGYAPTIQWTYSPAASSWVYTASPPQTTHYNAAQAPLMMRPSVSGTAVSSLISFPDNGGYGTMTNTIVPTTSYSSTGGTAYLLMPIMWAIPSTGIPVINISSLSGVYLVPPVAGGGVYGDTITVGSDTYIYLPLGNSLVDTAPTRAIAVLRS